MKTRQITHLISVALLLLWGGVMIYFYASGRLAKGEYVSKNGWFTTMVIVGGIGCILVGLFNLLTMGASEASCCEHDHSHGDDDHKHDHDHSHKEGGCCGHDHSHDHGHEHKHECCGHDHGHEHKHEHSHACCAHDHHHHHEEHDHAGHAHGIIEESGLLGRIVAITILAVPITYASIKSPDRYTSAATIANRGVYDQSYQKDAKAGKFDLKKADTPAAKQDAPPAAAPSVAASLPPAQTAPPAATTPAASTPPADVASAAPSGASQSKSYGSFTLKDLEAQVPRSKDGNFQLEVPEIYYTAGDKEVQSVITGQPIETTAQVIPEKVHNEKGTRVRIFRLLIQCCAADARPYSVPVEFGKEAPKFKEMSWVKVVGKMNYVKEGDQIVPIIEATSMTEAPEPDNKMVY